MKTQVALTYDDIQLIPQYSEIESRSIINLKTKLTRTFNLGIPYLASPMDTICEVEMAKRMYELGGVGVIHRFLTIEEQANQIKELQRFLYTHKDDKLIGAWGDEKKPIVAAIGSNGDFLERATELWEAGANVLLIDVAHGHHKNVKEAIRNIKSILPVEVIAGNIATARAAEDLIDWGSDGLRVGIGGGSLCTTRVQTGHGIPNVTSLIECSEVANKYDIPIMADGGLRSSGDIAKAIAVGADNVMLGSLLAGTQETPGPVLERNNQLFKRYRGSASLETKSTHGQEQRNVEGESTIVPFKGGVKFVVRGLNDGLRSALSYSGCLDIKEFQVKASWVQVTNAGMVEAKPHKLL
jgi:IMP dehydrogenase